MPEYLFTDATVSDGGVYRYDLTRVWEKDKPGCCFIMLNPSTADASEDDPTIRRCVGFAREWGFGKLVVVNLFAYRATDPGKLYEQLTLDPIGPENDAVIVRSIIAAHRLSYGPPAVIAAWGAHGNLMGRALEVRKLAALVGVKLSHLGLTKDGLARHPLYLKGSTAVTPYHPPEMGPV